MNAIKLHGLNTHGIPYEWPARRQPLPAGTKALPDEYPASEGWQLMSDDEFDRYCADRRENYEAAMAARVETIIEPIADATQLSAKVAELEAEILALKSRVSLTESKQVVLDGKIEAR